MFPLSDSIKSKSFPLVTITFIAINIYVFFKELVSVNPDQFVNTYALIPSSVHLGNPQTLIPFVTAMFLHGGFLHIISNMWFLWIFGDNVESYFGKIWYTALFLGAGLAGNILQFFLSPHSTIPMLGASGAISGVLGAYYILYPHSRIKTLVPIFLFITVIDIPAVIYLFYWFFIQLFSGIASIGSINQNVGGVAFWAHIGGFISGILAAQAAKNESGKGFIEGEIV